MSRYPSTNRRRGVLLLIVLSLLVLFVLIGVTFVVVANQYTKAAKSFAKHELKGDRPQQELDSALMNVLRGSTEASNPTYDHSLLEDLYGNDGFVGRTLLTQLGGPHRFGGLQFRRIVYQDLSLTARPTDNYYAGSVLTLIDGQGARRSARILRYVAPVANNGILQGELFIEAFVGMRPDFSPSPKSRFVVNGKPFNGVGKGLMDPTDGDLTERLPPIPTVLPDAPLMIGGVGIEASLMPLLNWHPGTVFPPPFPFFYTGDGDESWDAADYQNMFLARVPSFMPNDRIPRASGLSSDPLIPSFHRPYLINHLLRRLDAAGWDWSTQRNYESILRYATARPLPFDHPFFTGSNSAYLRTVDKDRDGIRDAVDVDFGAGDSMPYDPPPANGLIDIPLIRGPWDVDNDLDGVADSVWIDLGAPVKTSPDGRVYKPLFAVLCLDMDGRINLNAHGTREMLTIASPPLPDPDPRAAGTLTNVTLGQGYGPAEIRLDQLIQASLNGLPAVDPKQVFASILARRYQPRTFQTSSGIRPNSAFFIPGLVDWRIEDGWLSPGLPGSVDPVRDLLLNSTHLYGLPIDYVTNDNTLSPNAYGSPADIAGVGGIYLDRRGQPRFIRSQPGYPLMGRSSFPWDPYDPSIVPSLSLLKLAATPIPPGEALDNPYQIDLVNGNFHDSPFGEEDLEYLLRHRDADARVFDSALKQTLDLGIRFPLPDHFLRQVTTRSFEVPTPNAALPDDEERGELLTETQQEWNKMRLEVGKALLDPKQIPLTSNSLVDLAIKRLTRDDPQFLDGSATPQQVDRQLRLLLAPEIRQGKKFNINRLFGNGIDDDMVNGIAANGIVDEPAEMWIDSNDNERIDLGDSFAEEGFPLGHYGTAAGVYLTADPNFAAPAPAANDLNPYFSRQQYARYLFCLAMLAMDHDFRMHIGPNRTVKSIEEPQLTARRVAQWVVNVVDFRDPDAVMTPFEYDWQPFDENGWSVDGDFRTSTADETDRQIVWGCEAPELLITETLAFHDRRVRDTPADNGGDDAGGEPSSGERFPRANNNDEEMDNILVVDEDLDQNRVPQGSLFLELYAVGNAAQNNPVRPQELYDADGNLNLAAMAGKDRPSPVWRIAIAELPVDTDTAEWTENESAIFKPQFINEFVTDPDIVGAIMNDTGMLSHLRTDGLPDNYAQQYGSQPRFFVFTPPPTGLGPGYAPGKYFHNFNVPYGTSLPLAPGRYAVAGPRAVTYVGSVTDDTGTRADSTQTIVLTPSTKPNDFLDGNVIHGNSAPPNAYWNVVNPGSPPTNALRPLVLILQAESPWDGQKWKDARVGINVSEPTPRSGYYPVPDDEDLRYLPAKDVPFDVKPSYPLGDSWQDREGKPWPHRNMTGTYENFRVALLQRLADPTRPWNEHNPYITVDSQIIDLMVFNGEENDDNARDWENDLNPPYSEGEAYDEYDPPGEKRPPDLRIRFGSRQRGQLEESSRGTLGANIWSPLSTAAKPYLNPPGKHPDLVAANNNFPFSPYFDVLQLNHSLGALNTVAYGAAIPSGGGTPLDFTGSPIAGFPWFTWNNRPYVSNHELLLVPSSSPWRLMSEIKSVDQDDIGEFFFSEYAHLLNFFHQDPSGPDPNLAVLLDWVEVPSRFVGTSELMNPGIDFSEMNSQLAEFAVPMNKLSRFRNPGKVNINTIPDYQVWQAIDPSAMDNDWNRIRQSLQSDEPIGDRPAYYANPVRAAGSGDLMPLSDLKATSVDATLLRRDPQNDEKLLFDFESLNASNNARRNPYFRYHKLQRLSNLLTSHSNVYAVWITVGYFEAISWPNPEGPPIPDAAHPDGHQLGLEIGSDTGDVKRHRAFYLIDRSIPVGFERGKDHNVEDAILLRRFVE